ncbi:LLM class flavin-dependent oxidoreductase [Niallia nealsonii]|uniref:LLM class flavin-dependent oxidoreductase n=1 Tax=Niallia nealsonii TaxID=115979 RepID=A0A2N0Z037_9BACI|nr:LLM class flavin-dependent oxidoreductase [Niallia nealsonii]PKG22870.1 LLM class flavin-dependent oxidoreductase [Niallia nealsonii]
MKFILFSLMSNNIHPITKEAFTTQQKFQQVINQAVFAEQQGFDGFGVGERHGRPFLSSSPAVVLTAIAAKTAKIRLLTTVTVLSVLDPVRVAEDYATLDHLSEGRLELIIGKGNDPRHYPLFGISEEEQWESLAERYELLKRLWKEECVSWSGKYRPPLQEVTIEPRPYQKVIPIWHGSASSKMSTELAAKNGEPIFSSNVFHPMTKYKELIDHYKERLAYYGHNPQQAVIGSGAGNLYIANTKEEAIKKYQPYYEIFSNTDASKHNNSPFTDLEDNVKNGPSLVGSAESIIEKILFYHKYYGHQVQGISVDGLSENEQKEQIQRFAEEVIPTLQKEIPDFIWRDSKEALSN